MLSKRQASRFLFPLAPAIAFAVAGVLPLSPRADPAQPLSGALTEARKAPSLHDEGAGSREGFVMSPAGTSGAGAAPPSTAYRLGTAARPYGWSTQVADLNKDGAPDLAIADRIGRDGASYEYSLQISVSGLESETVSLQSEQEALTVGVSDIDHDNDLDVVVSGVLSHTIVGVWVNDGHGRFDRSQIRTSPLLEALATIGTNDRSIDPITATVSSHQAALKSSRARSPDQQQGRSFTGHDDSKAPRSARSSHPSRAPPLNPSPIA